MKFKAATELKDNISLHECKHCGRLAVVDPPDSCPTCFRICDDANTREYRSLGSVIDICSRIEEKLAKAEKKIRAFAELLCIDPEEFDPDNEELI